MRGTKHKNKRHSCGLCKPHKRGWDPKDKRSHISLEREHEREMREAKRGNGGGEAPGRWGDSTRVLREDTRDAECLLARRRGFN